MANDFMANINKVNLDGENVSFNKTFPNVEVVKPTEVVEEKSTNKGKKGKKAKEEVVETTVEETVENEVVEETPTEETTKVEE